MNQLFYNIAGGIVHQIRREKRTTISEVIACVRKTLFTFVPECSKNIVYVRSRTFERHYLL